MMLDPMSATQFSFKGPQSITDFPLRNQTILALAGFALLVLARCAVDGRRAKR